MPLAHTTCPSLQPTTHPRLTEGRVCTHNPVRSPSHEKSLFVCLPVLLMVGGLALPVLGADTLVRFAGGIGVIPVRGNTPPFTANTVLGVLPAGQPWVIRTLEAHVKTNGDITVEGEGLIRAGGNIGTTSADPIFATLFCGNVAHDSGAIIARAERTTSASTMCSRQRHRTPVIRLSCSSGTLPLLAIGSRRGFAQELSQLARN